MSSVSQGPPTERSDGRRNKQLILDAALAAFLENPQSSVGDIAERAGLTRATVYRHYPDREELIRAVTTQTSRALVPTLLAAMRELPWPDALGMLAHDVVTLGAQYREVIALVAPRVEESARIAVEDEPIQAEFAARRASGELTSPLSDEWLALCIRSLCLAAITRLTGDEPDVETTVSELTAALVTLSR